MQKTITLGAAVPKFTSKIKLSRPNSVKAMFTTWTALSLLFAVLIAVNASAARREPVKEVGLDMQVDGTPWLKSMVTPYERRGHENREKTYKVYTHLYDFEGKALITKGAGGKFTHHRGLFIGWKDTLVGDVDYDTWHMPNCYQQLNTVVENKPDSGKQVLKIDWSTLKGKPFICETRTLEAHAGKDGARIIDFTSHLESKAGDIPLKGDLQHAGMQIRLANEVSEHEETTSYILPEGIEEQDNNQVEGAWWVCCSAVVNEKRYWIIHMTPPTHPTGVPVYSIRRYARFGAFFEPTLKEDAPLDFRFRILVSERELDQKACQELYNAYAESIK